LRPHKAARATVRLPAARYGHRSRPTEPPGREPNPGTHVARVLEVGRRLDGSDIGGSDDGADAGGRHEPSAIRVVARLTEQEPVELGGTVADGAPSFQKR
jgi:hypothetical protein